jgi:radical SAM superfamily enzyme YgiQ (UPF0313 family)
MADVILIYPKTGFDIKKVSVDPPLSVLAASSLVTQDYQVKIIDQRIDPNWEETLRREMKANPLCVGVSSMTGPQIRYALQAARIVKEAGDSIKVVWGGVHGTLLPEQTVQNPLVDIVVMGEGELTFCNLVRALEKSQPLKDVKGIVFKENGVFVRTEPQNPIDIEASPDLPYHLVDMENYIGSQGRFFGENSRSLLFISSRGCPWECTYCCNPRLSKRRWRSMSAEKTYERVIDLVDRYRLDAITFHDEEFLVDRVRAEKIASFINGKFRWWIQARMDRLKAMDLAGLDRNGLCAVQPGIESGSDRILKMIRKGETVSDILEANRCLAKTSIIPLYNFMMGFPTESYEELMQSVDLTLRLLKENPTAQVSGFYVCVPYPGTELFDLALKEGFKTPQSLEEWSVYNRQHLKTPWIQDKIDIFTSIMVTSKLIDGTRLENRLKAAFHPIPIPSFLCRFLARFYRDRWEKHIFSKSLDLILNKILLFFFSLSQTDVLNLVFKKKKET